MPASASSTCPPARRRSCAARPAWCCRTARSCWSGWQRARGSWRDAVRLRGDRGPCRGDLPLGQPLPLPRAGRGALRAITLGMPYVEFDVPPGTAPGIARFYREIVGAPAGRPGTAAARVLVANGQHLVFRETDRAPPEFDGHHVQIALADFGGPYARLRERGLVSRGEQRLAVPLPGHRGPRQRPAAVHRGARGAQHDAPALRPAAGEPERGAQQPQLRPGHEAWAWAMPPC